METVNQIFLEYVQENYWSLIEFFQELDNEEIKNVKDMLIDYCSKQLDNYISCWIKNWEITTRDDIEERVIWFIENIELHELGMGEMNDVSEIVDDVIYRLDWVEEDEDWNLIIK